MKGRRGEEGGLKAKSYLARPRAMTTCDSILKSLDWVLTGADGHRVDKNWQWAMVFDLQRGVGSALLVVKISWSPEIFYLSPDSQSPIPDYPGFTDCTNPFRGDLGIRVQVPFCILSYLSRSICIWACNPQRNRNCSPGSIVLDYWGDYACPGSWDHAQFGLAFPVQITVRF